MAGGGDRSKRNPTLVNDDPARVKCRPVASHLSALLTKRGQRGDYLTASVNADLMAKYGAPDSLQRAIEVLRPVIRWMRGKGQSSSARRYHAMPLYPTTANGIALRWVVAAACARTYGGSRPNLQRGLVDEFDSLLQGTSPLFSKRFQMHRSPN